MATKHIDGLYNECLGLLDGRRALRRNGYGAAKNELLALSQGRSVLAVLSAGRFDSLTSAVIPLGNSFFQFTRFEADTSCETVSSRGPQDRYIFHIPLRGELEMSLDKRTWTVRPGEMMVVASPGKVVKSWSGSKDTLNCVVDRRSVGRLIATQFGRDARIPIEFPRVISLEENPSVLGLMAAIVRDGAQPNPLSRNSVIARQMGDVLVSSFLSNLPNSRSKELADEGKYLPLYLQQALEHIAADLQASLDLLGLAAQVGVSTRTLYIAFSKYLGTSPGRYLLAKRLEAARSRFLTERPGVAKIGETARAFGFVSTSHFSRAYLARFGKTPTATLGFNPNNT